MGNQINRRDFLRNSAIVAGGMSLTGCNSLSAVGLGQRTNMCGFAAKPIDKIKVAFVGLGMRGPGAVARIAKIKDVEIVALCDIRENRVRNAQKILKRNNRPEAKEFYGTEDAWKKMCQLDLDLVYIATPWALHAPMGIYAMEHGKHVAIEVPAATTMEECWALVNTSERTQKHCMQLENCCYDFFELLTFNMAREGVFGELTHGEGAYIHELIGLMANKNGYHKQWRLQHNLEHNGNIYPTHGLGPIAQCMDVNRGNKFDYLTSMSSQDAAFREWARAHNNKELQQVEKYRGDMNTTLIKLAKGQTIMVQHDVSTPRPYSRIHLLQGSKGMARKWPVQKIALSSHGHGHRWLNDGEFKEISRKYEHPLSKTMGSIAKKVGGHGGMDFIMDYRLIYCLKNGLPLDQDVYDLASWCAVTPLSEQSLNNMSSGVKIPDFTRGAWKTNKPLGVVTVDPAKLPVVGIETGGGKQLNVH